MFRKANQLDRISRYSKLQPTDIVDVRGASKILGLSSSLLNKWRAFRPEQPPPFIRSGRRIFYRVGDLHEWQEQRLTGGRHPRRPDIRRQIVEPRQGKE